MWGFTEGHASRSVTCSPSKTSSKKEMRQRGLMICKLCHDGIHDLIPNEKELAEKYHTKELLLANEAIKKHITWVRKQK